VGDQSAFEKHMAALGKKAEAELAQPRGTDKLVQEALAIEAEEARAAGAIGYMARLMVQVTMPHSKLDSNEFERSNGPITLRILAPSKVGLPYGHYPRLLLAWITSEAVKTRSPEIELGESLSAFIVSLGLIPSGGRWGTVPRLRDHMKRLFSSAVSWSYDAPGEWMNVNVQPVKSARLWWDPKQPDQATLWKSTITLTREFYEEIINRPVPLDMRALKALARLRSPLAIDIYTWLTYRMSYLREQTTVPWELLELQFGGDYARTRDFRGKFLERLELVARVYPQARLTPTPEGLVLRPSPTHVPRLLS
jgi:hypothetical protein